MGTHSPDWAKINSLIEQLIPMVIALTALVNSLHNRFRRKQLEKKVDHLHAKIQNGENGASPGPDGSEEKGGSTHETR